MNKLTILHTEASLGWGGQEIRILREAEGMRDRGHTVLFAVQKGAQLGLRARDAGFKVYEVDFRRRKAFTTVPELLRMIRTHAIQLVNTHSSLDAWVAGVTAKIARIAVVRTRHLSATIRPGLNSKLLYGFLADSVATTCEEIAEVIRRQAKLSVERCRSVPTGVDPSRLHVEADEVRAFRESHGIATDDCLCGTVCILRSWKGVQDLLQAANILRGRPKLKWLVVGTGPIEDFLKEKCRELKLESQVIFTGHLSPPYTALAAMDVFLLLSTANEGVSQASLQAGYLGKPMITTPTGGLKEVCQHGVTGFQVAINSPHQIAQCVQTLSEDAKLRQQMGQRAAQLVSERFTIDGTLDEMESIYNIVAPK